MPKLHDLIENMKNGNFWEPTFQKRINQLSEDQFECIYSAAHQAVCFDLGDTSSMPFLKTIPELFRLPYPVVWMESTLPADYGVLGMLAMEAHGKDKPTVFVLNKRLGVAWQLVGYASVFIDTEEVRVSAVGSNGLESEEKYIYDACVYLSRFLMALNCVNTTVIEHPAPKLINAKRKKKGKQPLFSYWTLHLPNESDGDRITKGTHESPRVHLRRGHVRQYSPGKYTWVQAAVVGNKSLGIVGKDYRFDASLTEAETDPGNARK